MRLIPFLIVCAFAAPKDPALQCGPGSHWVRAHHRKAYFRGDGTLVKETDVSAHCQKNPKGYSEWEPKLLDGKPKSWGPKEDKPGEWTIEERERVLEALAEIPDFLKNQGIDNIYRMHKPSNPDNPAATQGTKIALYDAAFNSNFNLTKVLAHEMAHRYYTGLSLREQNSFRDAAKWIQDAKNESGFRPGRPPNQFLRPNGMLSFYEDFADDLAAYVLTPDELKAKSVDVFKWMQRHVGLKMRAGGTK